MGGFGSALTLFAEVLRVATAPPALGVIVWILAIVFAWSGAAKLRRPARAAVAVVDFGLLRRVRPAVGGALGGAELALALALVSGVFPVVFAAIATVVLWTFVVLIARSLWGGERFACFCFGEAGSRLSYRTLLRTTALALLASMLAVSVRTTDVFDGAYALQAVSAAALLGGLVLAGQVPRLLSWNKDPYRIGKVEGVQ